MGLEYGLSSQQVASAQQMYGRNELAPDAGDKDGGIEGCRWIRESAPGTQACMGVVIRYAVRLVYPIMPGLAA